MSSGRVKFAATISFSEGADIKISIPSTPINVNQHSTSSSLPKSIWLSWPNSKCDIHSNTGWGVGKQSLLFMEWLAKAALERKTARKECFKDNIALRMILLFTVEFNPLLLPLTFNIQGFQGIKMHSSFLALHC